MDSEALKGRPAEAPSQACRDPGEDLSQGEETVGQKESEDHSAEDPVLGTREQCVRAGRHPGKLGATAL